MNGKISSDLELPSVESLTLREKEYLAKALKGCLTKVNSEIRKEADKNGR